MTPGLQASAESVGSRPGGGEILLLESVDGASGISTLDVRSGKVTPLWSGPGTLSLGSWNFGLSVASDGKTCAVLRETFSDPPGGVGRTDRGVEANDHVTSRRERGLGKAEEHRLDG